MNGDTSKRAMDQGQAIVDWLADDPLFGGEPEPPRPRIHFSLALGEIIVERMRSGSGGYWATTESLHISKCAAASWRNRGIAGEEPYRTFWTDIERARRRRESEVMGLTDEERTRYIADLDRADADTLSGEDQELEED